MVYWWNDTPFVILSDHPIIKNSLIFNYANVSLIADVPI